MLLAQAVVVKSLVVGAMEKASFGRFGFQDDFLLRQAVDF